MLIFVILCYFLLNTPQFLALSKKFLDLCVHNHNNIFNVPEEVSCRILNDVLTKAGFNTSDDIGNLNCPSNENACV